MEEPLIVFSPPHGDTEITASQAQERIADTDQQVFAQEKRAKFSGIAVRVLDPDEQEVRARRIRMETFQGA
jgi:hypothetical protein